MASILTIEDLRVEFDGESAIENLTFTLEPGESLAIIGPNGAGKTVLLRSLLGMTSYKGTIAWGEHVRIGYVPQKIEADRHLPVNVQNLLHAKAATLHIPKSEVQKTIAMVGLNEKTLATPVGHLSGGQFQRSLIAFALLGSPNVLILDEPTASIDKPGEEAIYELLHRLHDKLGMALILVSHDLSVVYRYADKVLCLNRSGVCYGSPEEALTPDVLARLYGSKSKYYQHHSHD